MKYWFDPIASGRRLRKALEALPPFLDDVPAGCGQLVFMVDGTRMLTTPEGRAALWALDQRLMDRDVSARDENDVYLPEHTIRTAVTVVHATYQDWVQQRIRSVATLLQSETATMRPTVAGLLFVLLVNRNTARERRLPAPDDPRQSEEISRAITGPALAFARAMAGTDNATARGLDLYRGWALGEIARRLGSGLHRDAQGIWIDPADEPRARQRLIEAIRDRPEEARKRVPQALDAALHEYNFMRPILSALGVAHERHANTRKLMDELRSAAVGESMGFRE